MVLTAAQINAFFTDAAQMAIPAATFMQLQHEGIANVGDLSEFDRETFKQVVDNLRSPGGRIPNPDHGAPPGSTIPRPPFVFGAKSHRRLMAACDLVRFYEAIGRDPTAGNIRWDPIIKNFEQQWTALKDRKENDEPEVPKITKSLPIIKWVEAFRDYCHRKVGARTIPRAYVIRSEEAVPAACPPLANNKPHSTEHGSVEGDLITRASHTHPLYRDDNAGVYYDIETAVRGTQYAASIKPFQRTKDGRGAFQSLCGQHAGDDKWQAELKKADDLLHNRVWKGQGNFPLERFVAQHRNAYITMQECAEHVPFQLPNAHTRVGYLLEGIKCSDADLLASIALVKNDDGTNGKRSDFEATAAFIIPNCPVAKRKQQNKRAYGSISATDGDGEGTGNASVSATSGIRSGIGKTGVEFRFYKKKEYDQLSKEQKNELREYRDKQGETPKKNDTTKQPQNGGKKQKQMIAAAVKKEIADLQKAEAAAEKAAEVEVDVATLVKALVAKATDTASATASATSAAAPAPAPVSLPPKVTIKSILKRANK